MRTSAVRLALAVLLAGAALVWYARGPAASQALFDLTGEEQFLGQARGLWHLALDLLTRPPLDLRPETPIAHNGVNPYAINTFLQHEVEPAKRERQVQLIAEAGFHWIRQEFPWYDLEIAGKGNFDDCRFPPCKSAWEKYDQIVALAEARGLEIIARLSSPPAWSRADGTARGDYAPPDHFSDFADYAATVAGRYRGRIRHYQVWNEPNIYYEWGNQPADPEAYTDLLCLTYQRLKAVDPSLVVISGVLAPTSELGALNEFGGNNVNDFVFLQRMYQAGARECFDVLSVQGYGLWSGPSDHRMRPIVVNYGRNQFIRDLMVANGDAHKAIWIAEMNWNAVPEDSGIPPDFGRVTLEQQARYAPLAYQRAQQEWPWVGVNAFWFFKRADDSEKNQAWYYFRMAEPDFTLLPVYHAMREHLSQPPAMYPGWFQEDHWAAAWDGWRRVTDPLLTLGVAYKAEAAGASLRFDFVGTDLFAVAVRGPLGQPLSVRVDGGPARTYELRSETPALARLHLARALPAGRHSVEIVSLEYGNILDGFIVRRAPDLTVPLALLLAAGLGGWWWIARRAARSHASPG